MLRNLRAAGLAVAVSALLAAPVTARPDIGQGDRSRFTYAVGDAQGPGIFDRKYPAPLHTPTGTVAAASWVKLVPSGSSFTIHIDDYALPDGQQVFVMVGPFHGGWAFFGCVPVRSQTKITGLRAGEPAEVSIGMPDQQVTCGLPVTAGVVAVRGAELAT